jgi:hypothetical protein
MTQPTKATPAQQANRVTPRPRPEVEVGVSAYLPFVQPYSGGWEVLRNEEISVKQLAAMRKTDGQARALYRLITLPIRAALKAATFVPEDHTKGGDEEAAFVEQMFTLPPSAGGMLTPFSRVIAQMLLAIFDGFTGFELVYWSPSSGPLKGKWTLKKIAHRPSETLTFRVTDTGEFDGFRQRTVFKGQAFDKPLPGEHTIYYAANEEEKPFYGLSYFQSAYYHWDKKFKLYIIAHIAAQRAAVGTRVGKIPANPGSEEKRDFIKALADLGVAQYIAIPDDYSVDSLKEVPNFDFLSYINHHNSQMSKSVLASFFDKEQGGGDSGKLVDFGQQSDALFLLMLQTIMAEIEDVINTQIVPRFVDWNFDSGKYPKFQFGSLSQDQKQAVLDLYSKLSVAGQSLISRPEFLHELEKQVSEELGLELDWDTIEKVMEEEKLAQQQQEEQMAAQQIGGGPGGPPGGPPAPGAAPAGDQSPLVDPSLLPAGFTLSNVDDAELALTDLARDLLADAYDSLELTRGKAAEGFKRVQTPEGSKVYGVPIGTPITRDMQEKQGSREGPKGGPSGGVRRGNAKSSKTQREVLGGGPGAAAQHPGNVNTGVSKDSAPHRVFSHPDQPGVTLLDFGDGTVAVKDARGNVSARQRFPISAFLKLGWKPADTGGAVKAAEENARRATGKPDSKTVPGKK